MKNIPDIYSKIKPFTDKHRETMLISGICIFSCIITFCLGWLAGQSTLKQAYNSKSGIGAESVIINAPEALKTAFSSPVNTKTTQSMPSEPNPQNGDFYASNRGTYFYTISCKKKPTIKEENIVYFKTYEDAVNSGLTPHPDCF